MYTCIYTYIQPKDYNMYVMVYIYIHTIFICYINKYWVFFFNSQYYYHIDELIVEQYSQLIPF
eukprot:UN04375